MSVLLKEVESIAQEAQEFIDSGAYLTIITGIDEKAPWSPESLKSCEESFLQKAAELTEESKYQYLMFLGEGLRRNFAGVWSDGSKLDSADPELAKLRGIYYPASGHLDVVSNLVNEAESLATGEVWKAFYQTTQVFLREQNSQGK